MAQVAAVIFDLDGCLVDSEPMSLGTLAEEMAGYGLIVTPEEMRRRYLGLSLRSIIAEIEARSGQRPDPDFIARFEERLLARYPAELRLIDGAESLLDLLAADGLAMAIATGGSLLRLATTLRVAKLARHFPATAFSADQVTRGKPAPDLFLLAASKLGVAPERCVVVEDSPHGIRGAVAAGMRAIGFVGGSHLEGLRYEHAARLVEAGAVRVLDRLDRLPTAFSTLSE